MAWSPCHGRWVRMQAAVLLPLPCCASPLALAFLVSCHDESSVRCKYRAGATGTHGGAVRGLSVRRAPRHRCGAGAAGWRAGTSSGKELLAGAAASRGGGGTSTLQGGIRRCAAGHMVETELAAGAVGRSSREGRAPGHVGEAELVVRAEARSSLYAATARWGQRLPGHGGAWPCQSTQEHNHLMHYW